MAERLHRTQASLGLQEEVTLRTEENKRSLEEQLSTLRASQQAAESECRALKVVLLVKSLCHVVIAVFCFFLV